MKKVPLTKGLFALVDDSDFKKVSKHKWYASNTKSGHYATRNNPKSMVRGILLMHREIMQPPKGMVIDHANHDTLDNRRHNLRVCFQRDNQRNQKLSRANTSGYKGVYFRPTRKKYQAQIKLNGKTTYLGVFIEVRDAASAYNKAATIHFGEFALLNKI